MICSVAWLRSFRRPNRDHVQRCESFGQHGVEQATAVGGGLVNARFQPVAARHQGIDLRDDAVLLGEGGRGTSKVSDPELTFNMMDTSFFLSRRNVRASKYQGMPVWQDMIFIFMARNANDASSCFRLPPGRVIEVGSQITV
jgi:hypothetical protein